MLLILSLIIAFIIIRKVDTSGWLVNSLICAVVIAVAIDGICFSFFHFYVEKEEKKYDVLEKTEIISLQDTNGVSGNFYLGCGSIDGELYYAYYYETEYGIKYGSISGENSRLPVYIKYLENPSETPYILQYGKTETIIYNKPSIPLWISAFAQITYGDCEDGEIIDQDIDTLPAFIADPDHYRYEIWIPEGSILQEYELDLK